MPQRVGYWMVFYTRSIPMIMQPITVQVVQEQQKELHFLAGKFLLAKSHQVNLFLWEPPQGFPLTAVFNLKTVCE